MTRVTYIQKLRQENVTLRHYLYATADQLANCPTERDNFRVQLGDTRIALEKERETNKRLTKQIGALKNKRNVLITKTALCCFTISICVFFLYQTWLNS